MSKAEERAQEAYPAWRNGIGDEFSSNSAYYGFIEGYHQAEKDVLDVIEKELTRRMLEDYNEGAEEDEIAQGCMASLIMFVRQMKEE